MKKILVFIICIAQLLMVALPSYAETDKGTLLVEEIASWYADEMAAVEKAVRASDSIWDSYIGDDREEVSYKYMYQIYYLEMKDIVSAYDDNGNFRSNISDKYYWVVPSYEHGGEVQVVRSEQNVSGWDIRRGTEYYSNIKRNHPDTSFALVDIYNNIFNRYPDTDKGSIRIVYEEETDTHLVFFACERSEYVVPYFPSTIHTWQVNGRVYPVIEYIDLIRENISKESKIIHHGVSNEKSEKIYVNYIFIGSAAVICVATGAVIIAKKKKKRSE